MRFVVLGVCLSAAIGCAMPYSVDSSEKIFDGESSDAAAVVQLVWASNTGCSGVHIGDGLILTAAHCIHQHLTPTIKTTALDGTPVSVRASGVVVHPQWREAIALRGCAPGRSVPNGALAVDMALLRADAPFDDVPSLPLATIEASGTVEVIGWGATTDPAESGRRSTHAELQSSDASWLTRYHSDGSGTCIGDSGGAVVQDDTLVAIHSGVLNGDPSTGCGSEAYGSSIIEQSLWIDQASQTLLSDRAASLVDACHDETLEWTADPFELAHDLSEGRPSWAQVLNPVDPIISGDAISAELTIPIHTLDGPDLRVGLVAQDANGDIIHEVILEDADPTLGFFAHHDFPAGTPLPAQMLILVGTDVGGSASLGQTLIRLAWQPR